VRALVVTPDRNTPGRNDFSGAFRPEARAFCKAHGVPVGEILQIDISADAKAKRAALLKAIPEGCDTLAIFAHGLHRKLPHLGWDTGNVPALAAALARASSAPRVILYACSTANGPGPGGDGGFADALRDALVAAGATGAQVDAHTTAGHTTVNPYVRRFDGASSAGGAWLIEPGTRAFRRWRALLRTPFRFEFPFLDAAAIAARVG
jgi:hypothetical protein